MKKLLLHDCYLVSIIQDFMDTSVMWPQEFAISFRRIFISLINLSMLHGISLHIASVASIAATYYIIKGR